MTDPAQLVEEFARVLNQILSLPLQDSPRIENRAPAPAAGAPDLSGPGGELFKLEEVEARNDWLVRVKCLGHPWASIKAKGSDAAPCEILRGLTKHGPRGFGIKGEQYKDGKYDSFRNVQVWEEGPNGHWAEVRS
mgnify:FL=1|tara:strand:+ start:400 stop:804 length:405 start_codon:yes stop_codon:yes gene_type:complete